MCAAGNGNKWVENCTRLLFPHDFHWSSKTSEPLIKETDTRENVSLDGKRECFIGWSQSGKPLWVSGVADGDYFYNPLLSVATANCVVRVILSVYMVIILHL